MITQNPYMSLDSFGTCSFLLLLLNCISSGANQFQAQFLYRFSLTFGLLFCCFFASCTRISPSVLRNFRLNCLSRCLALVICLVLCVSRIRPNDRSGWCLRWRVMGCRECGRVPRPQRSPASLAIQCVWRWSLS